MKAVPDAIALPFELFKQLPAKRVIKVDHGEAQLFAIKELGFRLSVGLHGPMIIKMVSGQVSKYSSGYGQVIYPSLVEGMGRHFHHSSAAVLSQNLMQHPINLHNIRGGMGSRLKCSRHAIPQCTQHAARYSRCIQQL